MATLFQKIRKLDPKKTMAVVLAAGLVAVFFTFPFADASGPQFNIFPISYTPGTLNHDLPMIDAKNITKGIGYSTSQSDHDNGIQASAGDILEFSIYFHNGTPNTDANIALNTLVKASVIPIGGTSSMSHQFGATISASNASPVTAITRGGDMTVHIQGGQPLSLSYIPGSTILYKDRGVSNPPSPQNLPDSIFDGGVNIGSVRGCFEFHGFVNFRVRINQPTTVGDLQVKKFVRNVTTGSSFEDVQVAAQPGQTVEFKVVTTAVSGSINNVYVRDSSLDSRLSLVGAVTLDGFPVSTFEFFNSGVALGNLSAGGSRTILFQAVVAGTGSFTSGIPVNMTDTATAQSGSILRQDSAMVTVTVQAQQATCTFTYDTPHVSDGSGRGLRQSGQTINARMQVSGLSPFSSFNFMYRHAQGFPIFQDARTANSSGGFDVTDRTTVVPPLFIPGDYNVTLEVGGQARATCRGLRIEQAGIQQIDLDKTVRNENTGIGFADLVDAQPGHRVTFRLTINPANSNTALQNVVIRDILPSKLTFVSGSLNVNGVSGNSGSFFGSGLNIGTTAVGQVVTVTFQADVASTANFTAGQCESLVNSGHVTASGGLSDADPATVRVCKDTITKQPGTPGARPQ